MLRSGSSLFSHHLIKPSLLGQTPNLDLSLLQSGPPLRKHAFLPAWGYTADLCGSSQGSSHIQMSCFWLFYEILIFHKTRLRYLSEGSIRNNTLKWNISAASPHYFQNVINIRVCRSFITIPGAPTPVSHATATRWVPSHGHVTQRLASASAGLVSLVASATPATTLLLRSQIPAVRVRGLFTVPMIFCGFNLTSLKREGVFISGVLSPLQSSMMAAQRPSLRGSGGHGQSSTCLQPYPAPKALSVRTRTFRNCSSWNCAHLDWITQICHVLHSAQVQPSGTVM